MGGPWENSLERFWFELLGLGIGVGHEQEIAKRCFVSGVTYVGNQEGRNQMKVTDSVYIVHIYIYIYMVFWGFRS